MYGFPTESLKKAILKCRECVCGLNNVRKKYCVKKCWELPSKLMYFVHFYIHSINSMLQIWSHSCSRLLFRKNCIGTHCKWRFVSIANCTILKDLRLIRFESFLPPLIVRVVLAPRHPLPHLGQALRELGGEQRVGVDGGELREERLVVRHEPGKETKWVLFAIFLNLCNWFSKLHTLI